MEDLSLYSFDKVDKKIEKEYTTYYMIKWLKEHNINYIRFETGEPPNNIPMFVLDLKIDKDTTGFEIIRENNENILNWKIILNDPL